MTGTTQDGAVLVTGGSSGIGRQVVLADRDADRGTGHAAGVPAGPCPHDGRQNRRAATAGWCCSGGDRRERRAPGQPSDEGDG